MARHTSVDMPSSKMKESIAAILVKEGYVKNYEIIENGVKKTMRITLKYGRSKNEKVIAGLKRISKPGLRVYANCEDIPKVLNGLGTAIVSTNKGILTDKEARLQGVGGEVLAFIW
jgi:small subunit ribosomal protein S8